MEARPLSQWSLAKAPDADPLRRGPTQQERASGFLRPEQLARLNHLTVILFGDEEGYSPTLVDHLRDWYEVTRRHYPHVLVHNNQWGSNGRIRTWATTFAPPSPT
ncbi:MAG: hypothetical protein MJD61_04165 [Proteobacteria bacterium]|nr:hypothetical protein [Pseudomonadota bacterium]